MVGMRADGTTAFALDSSQILAFERGLSINPSSGSSVSPGVITWDYSVAESEVDFLAVGEQVIFVSTITVSDPSSNSSSQDVTIIIISTNDRPTLTVINATDTEAASASAQTISKTGTVTYSDLDAIDSVQLSATFSNVSWSGGSLTPTQITNLSSGTFILGPYPGGVSGTASWSYDAASLDIDFLAAGETLTLTYAVTAVDNSHTATDTGIANVTITITGTNDVPDITVGAGNSASACLTETNAGLTSSSTLSVADVDTTNTVAPSVYSVVASGTTTSLPSNNAALLAMLTVDVGNVISNSTTTGTINWSFNSGSEYLAAGETLTLTYTVKATDSSSGSDTQTVTVTITGTNDTPILTVAPTALNPTDTSYRGNAVQVFNSPVSLNLVETTDQVKSLTFTLTNVSDAGDEKLQVLNSWISLTDGSSAFGASVVSGGTAAVTMSGTTATIQLEFASFISVSDAQLLLATIYYRNDKPAFTIATQVLTLAVIQDSGTE
ncbi:MAG: hypothetical protein EoVTN8_1483 [Fluviibacter phosphoraccumulans EoVTN8]